MRLWHLSPTVNSIFKHVCAAIHWGYTSDFWSDPSSTSILYVCEQRRFWDCAAGCAVSPEPSLFAYAISTIISWAGSDVFYNSYLLQLSQYLYCCRRRKPSSWWRSTCQSTYLTNAPGILRLGFSQRKNHWPFTLNIPSLHHRQAAAQVRKP